MSTDEASEQTHADALDTASSSTVSSSSAPPPVSRRYFIRFEGNESKRWDGKEVELDGGWLESLYLQEDLTAGSKLSLPWPGKGKVTNWSVIVLDQNASERPREKKREGIGYCCVEEKKIKVYTKKRELKVCLSLSLSETLSNTLTCIVVCNSQKMTRKEG